MVRRPASLTACFSRRSVSGRTRSYVRVDREGPHQVVVVDLLGEHAALLGLLLLLRLLLRRPVLPYLRPCISIIILRIASAGSVEHLVLVLARPHQQSARGLARAVGHSDGRVRHGANDAALEHDLGRAHAHPTARPARGRRRRRPPRPPPPWRRASPPAPPSRASPRSRAAPPGSRPWRSRTSAWAGRGRTRGAGAHVAAQVNGVRCTQRSDGAAPVELDEQLVDERERLRTPQQVREEAPLHGRSTEREVGAVDVELFR